MSDLSYSTCVEHLQKIIALYADISIQEYFKQVHCVVRPYKAIGWNTLVKLKNPVSDFNLILRILDQLIELYPTSYICYILRARALWPIGYYTASMQDLNRALELNPKSITAKVFIAYVYIFQKKYDDALLYVNTLLLDYNNVEVFIVKHFIFTEWGETLTDKAEKMKKYVLALSELDKAALLFPKEKELLSHYHKRIQSKINAS